MAVVLLGASVAVSLLASVQLVVVLAVYVVVQLAYCFWLKHQAVLDICIVASGFLLRAIAGGAATGILLSQWFLLVAGFGSLFMVAGKRYAEMMLAERTGAKIRKALENYTASYLRFVWALSATVLITTYCLWAFDIGEEQHNHTWSVISIVPFVIAVLRYAVDVDSGNGGEPEEIALGDRVLQVLALLWVATLTLAVYAGLVGIEPPATLGPRVRGLRPGRRRLRVLRADHRRARRDRTGQARARTGAAPNRRQRLLRARTADRDRDPPLRRAPVPHQQHPRLGVRQPVHRRSPATSTGCSPVGEQVYAFPMNLALINQFFGRATPRTRPAR